MKGGKTHMINTMLTSRYEDAILELIENQLRADGHDLTQSDLQGRVTMLVNQIMQAGYEILKEQEA